jgi:hypothetical protein
MLPRALRAPEDWRPAAVPPQLSEALPVAAPQRPGPPDSVAAALGLLERVAQLAAAVLLARAAAAERVVAVEQAAALERAAAAAERAVVLAASGSSRRAPRLACPVQGKSRSSRAAPPSA